MRKFLKIASNLTSDSLNRQGHLCVEVGRKDDIVEVLFSDGVKGFYEDDCFEDLDDGENPRYLMQGVSVDLLKLIALGVIDVKELAGRELNNLCEKL